MSKTFHDPDQSGWAAEMRNDPLEVMTAVEAPILVLYGAFDPWVPVKASLERLTPLARTHANMEIHVIDDADHAMMTSASPMAQIDPKAMAAQAPESPAYFAVVTRWLTNLGLTR